MNLLVAWAHAFVLTLVVELGVVVPLLGRDQALPRRVLAVTFAQLASHPIVWLVLPLLGWPRLEYLLVAESFAVLSEWALYRLVFDKLSWRRALTLSVLANAASFGAGQLLHRATS